VKPLPLIATKFFQPPLPTRSVKRKQLVERIERGLQAHHPLILVSAPAGYGKSTLVTEWSKSSPRPIAWLTLDSSDNDPARFLVYLIAALQKVDKTIGTELMAFLQANQLPPRETITALLTEDLLNSKLPLVCVLDDFQVIQETAILEIIQALIAHSLPLQCIIVTREDPALPLGRLRANAQLTEIRAADLRFSKQETETFFHNVMQIQLTEDDLSRLEERTEGWVAGLQLAGLSMAGCTDPATIIASLSGNNRHILSYLTEEVLKQQPPAVQEFLLQTSILAKLAPELCNAVTQRNDSAALLEQLLASNLFLIPLDDKGHWYRYHPLFSDLLHSLLKRSQPEQIKPLHLRAAAWFERQTMPVEAIDHALSAQDFARAASLLEAYAWMLTNQGYVRRVEAWIQLLPAEWRAHSPRTNLSFAWMYLLRGNFAKVLPHLQHAESALEHTSQTEDLQAECLALKANLMQSQGKVAEAIQAAQNALEIVTPDNTRVLGLANLALGAGYRQAVQFDLALAALQKAIDFSRLSGDTVTGTLAATHIILMSLQHGRLNLAQEISSQIIHQIESSEGAVPPIIGAIYGALGVVYYERNQVAQAQDYYLRGIQLGTYLGHHASVVYAKLDLTRLLLAQGNWADAQKNLQDAQQLLAEGAPVWLKPSLIDHQVQYFLATNNLKEAEATLRQSGIGPGEQISHATDEIQLAWVRVLLMRGSKADLVQGIALAEKILTLAESGQRDRTAMLASVLGALMHKRLGNEQTALVWLQRALTLGQPEGYIRLFVDQGPEVAALLKSMAPTQYILSLRAAFPQPDLASSSAPRRDRFGEQLSERELEVLRLLAQGLKYAEIAERLVVSMNTVRFHVKSIYGKLGVDKQIKAIEQARELGWIE